MGGGSLHLPGEVERQMLSRRSREERDRKKTRRKKLKVEVMLNNAFYSKFLLCNETDFFVLSLFLLCEIEYPQYTHA